jgi:hypothetical protein
LHDLTFPQTLGGTAALNWAASELDLPVLADSGYEGAGHGIKPPSSSPLTASAWRSPTAPSTGCSAACTEGERGFAILVGRWKPCATPPPAHAGPATSSPPLSTSPISNTNTYRKVVEITSLHRRRSQAHVSSCHQAQAFQELNHTTG